MRRGWVSAHAPRSSKKRADHEGACDADNVNTYHLALPSFDIVA